MIKDTNSFKQYNKDMNAARYIFYFDWRKIFKQALPLIHDPSTAEYMGVIRIEDDLKTLYIHKMESSNITNSKNASVKRMVPVNIVEKYIKIPGYFLFHTHPDLDEIDPFPSDTDLFAAFHHSLYGRYVGDIVVSKYGIIVYYLDEEICNEFRNSKYTLLLFYTFCYDFLMAWNSMTSMQKFEITDYIKLAKKYGVIIIIIPSYLYISEEHSKYFSGIILRDRFIHTKHELLDRIKELIKIEERKEEMKKKKEEKRKEKV